MFDKYTPIQDKYEHINFRKKCHECMNHSNGPMYYCLGCKYEYIICSACQYKYTSSQLKSHKFQKHPFAKIKRWHHLIESKNMKFIDSIDVSQ